MTLPSAGTTSIIDGLPVQNRQGDIFSGEKRTELLVVPPLSRASPEIAIILAASIRRQA
jgi:hypothetical protein